MTVTSFTFFFWVIEFSIFIYLYELWFVLKQEVLTKQRKVLWPLMTSWTIKVFIIAEDENSYHRLETKTTKLSIYDSYFK